MLKNFKVNFGNFFVRCLIFCILFSDIRLYLEEYNYTPYTTYHHLIKRQQPTTNCTQYEFFCKTQQKCIDKSIICDGVKDCPDGSDETVELCKKIHCPAYSFRCKYGACIDSTSKCDGRSDCVDNSDETDLECPPLIADFSPSRHCQSHQFECISGRCIDNKLLCNGKRDCDDGSDETIRHCDSISCPNNTFQCKYGACIDKKYKCDGVKNCPDGSDEFTQLCEVTITSNPVTQEIITTTEKAPTGWCTLPHNTPDKHYTVQCPEEQQKCNKRPGRKVPKFTEIHIYCNKGYKHTDGDDFISLCRNGSWYPIIVKCSKLCKKLNPVNVDLTCYRKGLEVDCEDDMLTGTSVRPRCKSQHREEFPAYYRDITCQEDGEWTNILFRCIPECGKPYANVTKLIAYGDPEKYGDSPWHVAIYNIQDKTKPLLICGGTIISPELITSAAHCFYDELNGKPFNERFYEVAVSKVTRNYTIKDNAQTKLYTIRKIFFSNKGYRGSATNYAADIVILWVSEKISLSRTVLPVCIYWQDYGTFNPGENTPGKIVGWGLDEKGVPSEILLTANLPYISYSECARTASEGFRNSITLDKFCAGTIEGPGARQGDSGGGMVFRDQFSGLYYLRGIISIKDPSETSVAAFTDITQYMDWIVTVRNTVENEAIKSETALNLKTK